MATLPLLESGRVGFTQVRNAVLPEIRVPQIDPIASRQMAQDAGTLSQLLDRMSQSAFGQAGKLQEQAGLEFAAQNPITPAQIEAAKGGNIGPLELGSNMNIFDAAVRKARSLELATHFEAEGKGELVKLLAKMEDPTSGVNAETVSQKIATMSDGLGKSLAQIDPDAAYKFRASMATYGNTVLKAAYENDLKRAKAVRIAKFDATFDAGVRLLEQAATTDPDNFEAQTQVFRENVLVQSALIGDASIQQQYSTKLETAVRNAKIQAVSKELQGDAYMADPVATWNKINAGDAGNKSAMLKDLQLRDADAVAKIQQNFMTAVTQRENLAKAQRDEQKRTDIKEFIPLYDRAVALPEGSAERRRLTDQISAIAMRNPDAVPLSVIKDLREPSKEGNPVAEFNVLRGIFDGTISNPDQIWNAPGLIAKQKVAALKLLNSEERRDQNELDRGLARLSGIPTVPGQPVVLDPKGEEFKRYMALKGQAQQIQADATKEGKIISPRQVLNQLTTDLEQRRNTEEAKAARLALERMPTLSGNSWITGPITRENLPALERLAGNDPNKKRTVERARNLLNQAEGN